jgi:DHA2 family multidrug resistance protein
MFLGFFCLFGSIVLLPLYVQQLMGYTAFWAGLVLGPGGISSFVVMPLSGFLMKKGIKPRSLLMTGLGISAYALWMMSNFNLQGDFYSIALPRFVQGFGLGMFFVPLAGASFVNIGVEQTANASGVFNLLRNLGGSFGTAFSTTLVSERSQFHQTFLSENISPFNPAFREAYQRAYNFLSMGQSAAPPSTGGLEFLYREIMRQASMLSFNDAFYALAIALVALIPLTLLLKKGRADSALQPTDTH